MSPEHGEERLPDPLEDVAEHLRNQRPRLEPLEVDRIKLRAMSGARGSASSKRKRFFMRSRLVALLTVAMLALGTGSAVAGWFVFGGGFCGFIDTWGASYNEYKIPPPCKEKYEWVANKCVLGAPGHYWHLIYGFCWIQNSKGGWTWGYGYGWVWE